MSSSTIQIFVSSTWLDLQPERKAVETAIHRLRETKFVGMEYFGSRDETTRRASLDEVDRSEVYLGIFGGRYGSGITEDEYRRARERGLPCLIYCKREADVTVEQREQDTGKATRLAALKEELRRNHAVTEFTSPDDLAAKVTSDLHRWLFEEYLKPKLEAAAKESGPRPEIESLLAAIKEANALSADLMARLRKTGYTIAEGQGSIAIGGDVSHSTIITSDSNTVLSDSRVDGDLVGRDKVTHVYHGPVYSGAAPPTDTAPASAKSRALAIWIGIVVLVLGVLTIATYQPWGKRDGIYRVRVTVTDTQGTPVEEAKVWSSMGGEPKKVAGGWQFDIPAATKPQDGKLTIFAKQEAAHLRGQQQLVLSDDFNPGVIVQLTHSESAKVKGIVHDSHERPVVGALVWVVGYESEAIPTGVKGDFELPAHADDGESVALKAEKKGVGTASVTRPAGRTVDLQLIKD